MISILYMNYPTICDALASSVVTESWGLKKNYYFLIRDYIYGLSLYAQELVSIKKNLQRVASLAVCCMRLTVQAIT